MYGRSNLEEKLLETTVTKRIKNKRHAHYLGAVPWGWLCKAAKCPGKSLHVALVIRHQAKLEKKSVVSLGSRFLNDLGVSKDAKSRAILALEQEGLIKVSQRQGANPIVTIIEQNSTAL